MVTRRSVIRSECNFEGASFDGLLRGFDSHIAARQQ